MMLVCADIGFSQSVTITAKKEVYRRPKPIQDFKRTFTIRRPIAKASTPALSKKITAAINPESVLDIRIKDELRDEQWLEEADYKVIYNQNGILTIKLWMEGTAAYPDSVTKYIVVDLRSGNRLRPADVFADLNGFTRIVKGIQSDEVRKSIVAMKKDPDIGDSDPSQLFSETDFKADDLKEFSVNGSGVTFHYDYGFPHVLKAVQPPGEYALSWTRLKPFIRRDGLLARFIR